VSGRGTGQVPISCHVLPWSNRIGAESLHFAAVVGGAAESRMRALTPALWIAAHAVPSERRKRAADAPAIVASRREGHSTAS